MSDSAFIKGILKHRAYQNIPLTFDEAFELGVYALKGCRGDLLAQVQSITALSALHNMATYARKSETNGVHPRSAAEQLAGICAAIFEHDIKCSESGFLMPNVPYVMDNCGMGGDLRVTPNVSTISALIVAAMGARMCKHGSPANADAGRHGSSDFVAMCGLDTMLTRGSVEALVEQQGFGYTEALDTQYKLIHMQTHSFAELPHMNDIIGPMTNPVHPHLLKKRILGVNHVIPVRVVAETYRLLNDKGITAMEHAFMVRGYGDVHRGSDGMDELSICAGGTDVAELLPSGNIVSRHISAEEFGLEPVPVESISPPDGMNKGQFSLAILRGEIKGPPLQMVLANAALLLHLHTDGKMSLADCYKAVERSHAQGNTLRKVEQLCHQSVSYTASPLG